MSSDPTSAAEQSLAAYLDDWLAARAPDLRPATLDTYRRLVRLHIVPHLGARRLLDLTPQNLQVWLGELARKEARGGGRLSPRTIRFTLSVLRAALADAERLGILGLSPMRRVRAPRPQARLVPSYTLEEMRRLDLEAAHHRLGPLFSFLWQTGLRIGEALALRWSDVDLEDGTLRVQRSAAEVGGRMVLGPPKSLAGLREIALTPRTLDLLRCQRSALAARSLGACPLVFPSARGTLLSRRNASRAWASVRADAGLAPHGLHALRHTNASLQLQAGIGLREIAAHLGHESPALTARVYAHVLVATRRQAALRLSALLAGDAPQDPAP